MRRRCRLRVGCLSVRPPCVADDEAARGRVVSRLVAIGQTPARAQEQAELVGQGYRTGRINADAKWTPATPQPKTRLEFLLF